MDTKDENIKEETIETTDSTGTPSLDDMMAEAIPADDTPSQDGLAEAVPSDEMADQIQDSTDSPVEETEVEDPAPNEEASTEEETDMIEEAAADSAEEAKPVAEEKIQPSMPAPKAYRGKWYIVHTYSGHENKVAKTLMQRVQAMGFEERIFDALVPTRDTIRVRGGKKETIKEKIFPGYM